MNNCKDCILTEEESQSYETDATEVCMTMPRKGKSYCNEELLAAETIVAIDPLVAPVLRLDSEKIREDLMEEMHNGSQCYLLQSHKDNVCDVPFCLHVGTATGDNNQDLINKRNGAIDYCSLDQPTDEVYSDTSGAENIVDLFNSTDKGYVRSVFERIECFSDYVPENSMIQLATRFEDASVEICYPNRALSSSEVVLGMRDDEISSLNASDPGTYHDCMTRIPLVADNMHSSPCASMNEPIFSEQISQSANPEEIIESEVEGAIEMPPSQERINRPSEETAFDRVREWINNIQPSDMLPLEEESTTMNFEHNTKQESAYTEYVIANAAVRSLHPLSTVAYLSGVGLQEVPLLGMFSCLKSLNLSTNLIVRVPIGSLPRSLHSLDLSRNRITQIEGLRELTRLRDLNLSYNRITRIGHGLSNCTLVKQLNLSGNKISEVEGFHRLLKLSILDLSFNKLSTSKDLGQLAANYRSLLAVNIIGNPIVASLGDDAIRKLVMTLLPHVIYLNNQPIKAGPLRETAIDSVVKSVLGTCHLMTKPTDRKNAKKIVIGAHKQHKNVDQKVGSDFASGRMQRNHYPPRYRQHSHS